MSKFPGQPVPVPKLHGDNKRDETLINDIIYTLKYIKGNVLESRLVRFDESLDIAEVIKASKRYCEVNRYRFVFIEPAITTIPANIEQEEIVE